MHFGGGLCGSESGALVQAREFARERSVDTREQARHGLWRRWLQAVIPVRRGEDGVLLDRLVSPRARDSPHTRLTH